MKKIDNYEKWLNEEIVTACNDSMDGFEFKADYSSVEEIQNAADHDDGNACYLMAKLNHYYDSDASENEIGEKYLKMGIEAGNRYCAVRYCERAMLDDLDGESNKDHVKSLIDLLDPLTDVSAHANYVLWMIYSSVPGCFNDYEKAIHYLRRAVDNCDYDAIYEMELLNANDPGLFDLDDKYFFNVLLKTADKGDKRAMHAVANYYFKGHGCEKDLDKAFEYAMKAAQAGNGISYVSLGFLYEYGFGTEADIDKAIACYKTAGDMGINDGYLAAGKLYYYGESVPRDLTLAVKYLFDAMNFSFDWQDDNAEEAADLVLEIAKEFPEAVDEDTLELAKDISSENYF